MGRGKGHIPIRTCISCRLKKEKQALLRLCVDSKGTLLIDDSGRSGGRGAYVCDSKVCIERLTRNKQLGRYFRSDKPITISYEIEEFFINKNS